MELILGIGQKGLDIPCDFQRDPSEEVMWPPPAPAIYSNMADDWPAFETWVPARNFLDRYQSFEIPLGTFSRHRKLTHVGKDGKYIDHNINLRIGDYLSTLNSTRRNMFLWNVNRKQHAHEFFKSLENGFRIPKGIPPDLKGVFAFDGVTTGHGMHWHHEAWLTQVAGRKVWWLSPPVDSSDSQVYPHRDLTEEEGAYPCGWLLQPELAQ